MKRYFFIFILLIGSCTVGPKYQTPENIVQDEWPNVDVASTDSPVTAWWTLFQDECLNKLIESAALNNKDIARAEAAICQARAMRDVAASKYFPQVTADLNAIKTYFSKNGPVFAISPGSGLGTPSSVTGLPFSVQIPQIQNLYTALFDATWEIDFFGKIRRSVEAAQARVESSIEQRNDILITVLAEVARNYMELRSFQEQSALIEESIHLLEQNAAIVQEQLAAGYVGQINLESIEAQLSNARANLPDTVAGIYRSIYALSMLTGNNPEALVDELVISKDLPKRPDIVSESSGHLISCSSLPSPLLRYWLGKSSQESL